MKISLTAQESENFFYNALCNGLSYFRGYGLVLDYDKEQYQKAKQDLVKDDVAVCFEDVLMKMLANGGELRVVDEEGDGDYNRAITIKDVHEKVQNSPTDSLMEMANEQDDACTADCILQTVFFDEVIFG